MAIDKSNSIALRMWAEVATGNGGYDRLDYRQVQTPVTKLGEALIRVLAASINNTEINAFISAVDAEDGGGATDGIPTGIDELNALLIADAAPESA